MAKTPPTTPPAIAPVGVDDETEAVDDGNCPPVLFVAVEADPGFTVSRGILLLNMLVSALLLNPLVGVTSFTCPCGLENS